MKKIVFFITKLGHGGAERVATNLANEFALDKNYKVYVILTYNNENAYKLSENIIIQDLPFHKNRLLRVLKRMYSIHNKLKKIKPSIVFSIPEGTAPYIALDTYINNSYIAVFSARQDLQVKYPTLIRKKVANFIFRRADKIVFQTYEQMLFFDSNIQRKGTIILNPLKNNLPKRDFNSIEKSIVTFCRLEKEKNIELLIDAFSEVVKEHSDFILRIWGKGSEEFKLHEKVNLMNLSNSIYFEGYSNCIYEQVKNAFMYINSSNHEGLSNAMLESMSMGLPVICTDCPCGGSKMIIQDHINGLLVPVKDKSALVFAIEELIRNDELRMTISENAMRIKKRINSDSVYKVWKRFVESE